MVTISCIIPAHNEQQRIGNVLRLVLAHPLIDEVIVVDDGSTDNTKEVVAAYNNVKIIVHPRNEGKGAALCTGIKESKGKFLFFLDADLVGLTCENITCLLNPVLTSRADVSISLRGSASKAWQAIGFDFLSGERVVPKKIVAKHLSEIVILPGYCFEVFLNELFVENRNRVAIVPWSNVMATPKYKKQGVWFGMKGEIAMYYSIFRTIPVWKIIAQIHRISYLKVSK